MPLLVIGAALYIALLILRAALGDICGVARLELGFSKTPGNRQINADEYDWAKYADETLLTLADGKGPGAKSQTASRIAVRIVSRVFEMTGTGQNPAYFFRSAFKGANSTILRYIPDSSAGASVLCAVVKDGKLYYALAGNCKICVFRRGELYEVSEGQTIDVLARRAYQRRQITRIDALEAAKESRLYNFVGKDGFRDLELFDAPIRLKKGDIIVLMTDGVYEFCTEKQLEEILCARGSCKNMAARITAVLDEQNHPEQDNASVILAKVNAV